MKKALSFITLAGICAALIITSGCTITGKCPPCRKEDKKLSRFSTDRQVCSECMKHINHKINIEKRRDKKFFCEIGDKEKDDQFCDECQSAGKSIKIVIIGSYLCDSCKVRAEVQNKKFKDKRR